MGNTLDKQGLDMDTRVQQKHAMPPPAAPLKKKEPPQLLYGKLSNFIVDKKVKYLANHIHLAQIY